MTQERPFESVEEAQRRAAIAEADAAEWRARKAENESDLVESQWRSPRTVGDGIASAAFDIAMAAIAITVLIIHFS